jgi:putative endonuclease
MFYTYVLRSRSTGRFYTGHASSIPQRKERHEQGLSRSTKGRGPWDVVYQEEFVTRAEAMRRERELKTGKGRDELKGLLAGRADGSAG